MQTEKQRERLVELIKNAKNDKNLCWCDLYDLCSEDGCCAEYFADYLMSNNVMVLPLKVGDRIYRLDVLNDKIIDWTIARIDIYDDEVVYCDDCFNVFTKEEFGIEGGVFLTMKEAEKALNERMLEEKENENHTMRND